MPKPLPLKLVVKDNHGNVVQQAADISGISDVQIKAEMQLLLSNPNIIVKGELIKKKK